MAAGKLASLDYFGSLALLGNQVTYVLWSVRPYGVYKAKDSKFLKFLPSRLCASSASRLYAWPKKLSPPKHRLVDAPK